MTLATETIPQELRDRRQWVLHRAKEPYQANGTRASSTRPETWCGFPQAVAALEAGGFDGIGFVFSEADPFVGIDLDDAVDDRGNLKPWAREIVEALDSWSEVSPSGRGVHIFVRSKWHDRGRKVKHHDGSVEVYDRARYFTVRGCPLDDAPDEIHERQAALDRLAADLFTPIKPTAPPPSDKLAVVRNNVRVMLAGTTVGKRSEVDFLGLCKLIEAGVQKEAAWEIVHDLSKFAERNGDYFAATWQAACRAVASKCATRADDETHVITELGFAERMVEDHQNELRFCNAWGWLFWTGTHWLRDDLGTPTRLATATVRRMFAEAAKTEDTSKRDKLMKEIRKYEASFRIRGITSLAESDPRIRRRESEFDTDPWTLNVRNGSLDLRTFTLAPHNPAQHLTKLAGADYDETATCPRWVQFVDEVFDGDAELAAFIQRAIGYSITGDTREQVLFLPYGTGANGKTVMLRVMQALLGDYATHADASTFMEKRTEAVRNDVARLAGARLVTSVETTEGQRLAESLVKQLTGGDKISARFLFREHFEFVPAFKLWLAANHKPEIRGGDFAIWRRVLLVPFNRTFTGPTADPELLPKLLRELPGILNWALTGVQAWLARGLKPPAAVRLATEQYRDEQDAIAEFLADFCDVGEGFRVATPDLYAVYKGWAERSGDRPLSRNAFGRRLTDRGFGDDRTGRARYRTGLCLRMADPVAGGGDAMT